MYRAALLVLAVLLAARPLAAQVFQKTSESGLDFLRRTGGGTNPGVLSPGTNAPQPTTTGTAPVQMAPAQEKLESFDPQRTEVQWSGSGWQLLADGVVIKSFGRREADARQALRLIRDLHLTQLGVIGSPNPIMEYWLSDGSAPEGMAPGLRTLPLDPARLRVEQMQGQWCVRDDYRVLFNFGFRADDAQQALAVIRKYGFTQLGTLGPATPSLMLFLSRQRDQVAQGVPEFTTPHLVRQSPLRDPNHPDKAHGSGKPGTGQASASALNVPAGPGGVVTPVVQPLGGTPAHSGTSSPAGLAHLNDMVERVSFDWRQVQLRLERDGWVLAAGSQVLARFGRHEREGRQALDVLRYYRFSEQCLIGQGNDRFSYFLVHGQAPRGLVFGLPSEAFAANTLAVRQVGDRFALTNGDQVLLVLGRRPDEANKALEEIRRHKFDCICRLTPGDDTGITFLVRSR